ncbi:MAG TPA: glycosyltransferase family 4 protein [Acidimicrobiia bacterium]|nr:glycosyltransferase family 4 protein [Acidimicrobiia bacterium]
MSDDRIGVLYLAPWVTIGGSDRSTIDWFRLIDQGRFRPLLMTTQESPNELFEFATRYAAEAWALPDLMPGSAMPRFIADVIASRDVRILHVMNSRLGFDVLADLRAAFPHLRVVAQIHAEEHPAGTGYPRYVASRSAACVDAISVISNFLAQRLEDFGVSRGKQRVIRLGVDTEIFDPAQAAPHEIGRRDGEFHVLFPARLAWQKDPLLMVEVAERLRARGSAAVIHVVGDGPLRGEVEAEVARHALGKQVRLHGAQQDMPGWYAATDVLLLTSRYEGVPLAVYEAMAMARPVVVAAVGGTGEVVSEEVGFLITERDDPDAFVEALLTLERDPILRRRMGTAGRNRAHEHYRVQHMAREHEAIYEELVESAPAPTGPADLSAFDDWWAPDTAALSLTREGRLVVRPPGPPRAGELRLGRVFTKGFERTLALREHDGRYSLGGAAVDIGVEGTLASSSQDGTVLGYALDYGLPGMVDVRTAVHRGAHTLGLEAIPEIAMAIESPVWIDEPELLPTAPLGTARPTFGGRLRRLLRRGALAPEGRPPTL